MLSFLLWLLALVRMGQAALLRTASSFAVSFYWTGPHEPERASGSGLGFGFELQGKFGVVSCFVILWFRARVEGFLFRPQEI